VAWIRQNLAKKQERNKTFVKRKVKGSVIQFKGLIMCRWEESLKDTETHNVIISLEKNVNLMLTIVL
jgi:hypothetical protein